MSFRPTVLVDFDGVLHSYSKGWYDGTVYDGPFPDALAALQRLEADGYDVVIFSTRSRTQITQAFLDWGWPSFPITNKKIPATAMIDDRAIRFTDWDSATAELRERYPAHKKGTK